MHHLLSLLPAALLAVAQPALADPWKDESGHGKHRDRGRGEYKEEFWDGNCKVERKLEKSGEYKEERKCKSAPRVQYGPEPIYVPAPVGIPRAEPGVTINGTIRIP